MYVWKHYVAIQSLAILKVYADDRFFWSRDFEEIKKTIRATKAFDAIAGWRNNDDKSYVFAHDDTERQQLADFVQWPAKEEFRFIRHDYVINKTPINRYGKLDANKDKKLQH